MNDRDPRAVPQFAESHQHPLRVFGRELLDLARENDYYPQIWEQVAHLCDYCQLLAGYHEGIQREAKMTLTLIDIKQVVERGDLDYASKIETIKTILARR